MELAHDQSYRALLTLAENSLKRQKKPLNLSAIVKDAERRAQERGLSLGVQARTRIKKAVEKLGESGAIAEAPRRGRAPIQYSLTPKAVKVFNDAKSHRRSDAGIAKEMSDILKESDRPPKRRRSSVSAGLASSSQPSQRAIIDKLKAQLAAAQSEIKSLKHLNQDLLDQQLDNDDDYDAFGSPTRKALSSQRSEIDSSIRPSSVKGLSFLGRPTRPTTPEPTEHGSPEYEVPNDIHYTIGMEPEREFTPPLSSPPEAATSQFEQEPQLLQESSETETKLKQLEASMAELSLEKIRMEEEIVALKNQVRHERETVAYLTQEKHEADLVRVELAQISKDRDSARRDVTRLEHAKGDLESRCSSIKLAEQELKTLLSKAEADIKTHVDIQSQVRAELIGTIQDLEAANTSLLSSHDEARRLTESLAVAEATMAVLNENILARESSYRDLQDDQLLATEQLRTLRSEVQSLRDTLSATESRATVAEATIAEHELRIGGLQADREAMQTTVVGLRSQKEVLAKENIALMSRIQELDALATDMHAQTASISSEAQGLRNLITDLQSSLNTVQAKKDEAEANFEVERSELNRSVIEYKTASLEATRMKEKLQDDLRACSSQLSDHKAEVARLNSTLSGLNSEMEVFKDSKTVEVNELNQRIHEIQRKDEGNMEQIRRLKTSLTQHKNSIEEHQDAISKLELQLDSLRQHKVESLRKRRARVEAEAKRLQDEEAELTQEAIDVDQWDESISQSRAGRSSLAPSFAIPSSP
ncbi:hypothetical protein BN14_01294 [Rhizoctonia solani AG-1 IB]|uniref:Uncharacterized protein n=1 Tax=Thanatephorus cucumeris (strain AG1-IB / isolate 7/3/14) TaxID=1108050 RepID=M5BJ39_THACB|nr:hypothetical protein BN14_01294 [Rhizoctonia solani AG-1 IB]